MGLLDRLSGKPTMVTAGQALPGRNTPVLQGPVQHETFEIPVDSTPAGSQVCYIAMGCFWGAEQLFWQTPGVTNTAAGYAGGFTPHPSYQEVCLGRTGHTETVRVCFDPATIDYPQLLKIFFENHDPTQGMRQGNDIGTQYRSAIYTTGPEQTDTAQQIRDEFQHAFSRNGYGRISTEILDDAVFYYAEDYHQQYLKKNPDGYCPVHATGVTCSVGVR